MADLWEFDQPITSYANEDGDAFEVPEWIEQDITPADVAAIVQGGCSSGAYMPAVTYHQALETMTEHGDEIFSAIEDSGMDIELPENCSSWASLACHFVSMAVELWANGIEDELSDALEEDDDDD